MPATSRLKITDLKLHSIAIADPPLRSSYGLHAPWALRTIVELETDSAITGYAETYGGEAPRAVLESTRPFLLGHDPFQLAALHQLISSQNAPPADIPEALAKRGSFPAKTHSIRLTAPLPPSRSPASISLAKPSPDPFAISSEVESETVFHSPPTSFISTRAPAAMLPTSTNTARSSPQNPLSANANR